MEMANSIIDVLKHENGKLFIQDNNLYKIKTESTKKIMTVFEESGFEIRIIGGAVRDILLGRNPKDIDFSTTATPEQIKEVCLKNDIHCVETGLLHGTLTAVINKTNFEITTLRCDDVTDGRHAIVSYIKDWKLDAERRDLTVNAMSVCSSGQLFDYFNGINDLQHRKIKFVNDPIQRIREDYLRILRYFRFYGKIAIEPATVDNFGKDILGIIAQEAHNLRNISVERLWSEFSQILVGNFAPSIVRIMWDCGVLENIGIPDLTEIKVNKFEQFWKNSTLRNSALTIPNISASALLSAFFTNPEMAETACKTLKLSNKDRAICVFVSTHNQTHNPSETSKARVLKRYQVILVNLYNKTEVPLLRSKLVQLLLCEGASNEDIDYILSWEIPLFPISGTQIRPYVHGPHISQVLLLLKEKWISSDFKDSGEVLIKYFKDNLADENLKLS